MDFSGKFSQEMFVELMNEIYTIGHLSETIKTKDILKEIMEKLEEVLKEN